MVLGRIVVPPLMVTLYPVSDILVLVTLALNLILLSVIKAGVPLSIHSKFIAVMALMLQQLVGVVSVTLHTPVQLLVVFVTVTV